MEGVERVMINLDFYRGKRVFVTGHTGFKGAWMCQVLAGVGAKVTGYALSAPTQPNLFELSGLENRMISCIGDVRDRDTLSSVFQKAQPEVVFHLAAQPIVRTGYEEPVYTYETNVMGTVNLLECIRTSPVPVQSVVIITTDKVYLNREWCWGYREDEPLNGYDPYSNSKSCAELVTSSYEKSFLKKLNIPVSTARAGNVIGGGDFARDRIVPDCIRSAIAERAITVRNPNSVRPYQHVLEPIMAYLMIAQRQAERAELAGCYNVGPDDCDCMTTGQLVDLFCKLWGGNVSWENWAEENAPHEANFLKLDCAKLKTTFGWSPRWHIDQAVEKTVEWAKAWRDGGDIKTIMDRQIKEYLEA